MSLDLTEDEVQMVADLVGDARDALREEIDEARRRKKNPHLSEMTEECASLDALLSKIQTQTGVGPIPEGEGDDEGQDE